MISIPRTAWGMHSCCTTIYVVVVIVVVAVTVVVVAIVQGVGREWKRGREGKMEKEMQAVSN